MKKKQKWGSESEKGDDCIVEWEATEKESEREETLFLIITERGGRKEEGRKRKNWHELVIRKL